MVNRQFQEILGRQPTQAETEYFSRFINAGDLDLQEVAQILQSMPEYQRTQLNRDVDSYGQKLQANDEQILRQGADIAGAQVNSRFAALGRPVSSAMGASVFGQTGQLANSLANNRQSALADFYGKGLSNISGMGAAMGNNAASRGYGLRDRRTERGYEIEDYYRQKNDAASYEKSHSGWNAITPEFAISKGIDVGGRIAAAAATGGTSEVARGLFSGGGGGGSSAGGYTPKSYNRYGGYA